MYLTACATSSFRFPPRIWIVLIRTIMLLQVTITPSDAYLTVTTSMPLVFTPGGWNSAQTVTVRATDDSVETADSYTSSVTHAAVSSDAEFDGSAAVYFPMSEVRVRTVNV